MLVFVAFIMPDVLTGSAVLEEEGVVALTAAAEFVMTTADSTGCAWRSRRARRYLECALTAAVVVVRVLEPSLSSLHRSKVVNHL